MNSQNQENSPSLQIFVCFHKQIYADIYKINNAEQKYITYYGVKERDTTNVKNIKYEYELTQYNPTLQTNKYNEGSCIYHVYINNLYDNFDYVGFCQYDMIFSKNIFINIQQNISNNPNTIFYLDFFKWAFYGGQTTIIKDYRNITSGLISYNKFFNKNYTTYDLISNKMIICNTYLISKKMYKKMMSWLIQYFIDDVDNAMCDDCGNKFDPGHMIEALTGMFLSLEISEGATYMKLDVDHDHNYKIN